ncbi:hypothetical protein O181_005840 [Austropuccinia psidii MF-1]|uniref:Uncharacterized protein n=1 Tax=Austropuccinia psidii MF-1 TaxID=1389203 RepID=A0A9Q3BJS0_9BASI|nr:hypothetical protein [Austropuccinia psidii MF-1]
MMPCRSHSIQGRSPGGRACLDYNREPLINATTSSPAQWKKGIHRSVECGVQTFRKTMRMPINLPWGAMHLHVPFSRLNLEIYRQP